MSTPKKKPAPTRQHDKEEKQSYGAATRSKKPERFDLIPPAALRAYAARMALGVEKHGEGNWMQVPPEQVGDWVKDCVNHLMGHICDLKDAHPQEDISANLGAILWNAGCIAHYLECNEQEVMTAFMDLREGKVG